MEIADYNQVWTIWQNTKDKLYAFLLSKFKNVTLAEDISQDILLKIHKSCCNGKDIKNLNAWLFQIAHNAGIDYVKKENQFKQAPPSMPTEQDEIWTELSHLLVPLIDFLPNDYSIPLKLSDIDGVPQQSIADQLDLSLSATKSRIQRARQKLREQIAICFHLKYNEKGELVEVRMKDT